MAWWEKILSGVGAVLTALAAFFLVRKANDGAKPELSGADVDAIRKQQEGLDAAAAQVTSSQQVVNAEQAKQTQLGQTISGVDLQLMEQQRVIQGMSHDQLQAEFDKLGAAAPSGASAPGSASNAPAVVKPDPATSK